MAAQYYHCHHCWYYYYCYLPLLRLFVSEHYMVFGVCVCVFNDSHCRRVVRRTRLFCVFFFDAFGVDSAIWVRNASQSFTQLVIVARRSQFLRFHFVPLSAFSCAFVRSSCQPSVCYWMRARSPRPRWKEFRVDVKNRLSARTHVRHSLPMGRERFHEWNTFSSGYGRVLFPSIKNLNESRWFNNFWEKNKNENERKTIIYPRSDCAMVSRVDATNNESEGETKRSKRDSIAVCMGTRKFERTHKRYQFAH